MKVEEVSQLGKSLISSVSVAIVGKKDVLEKVLLAILSDGHILIEDYPGLGKTLMAKSFAAALGCKFSRVQFTPDLLPADITGTYVFDRKSGEFVLRRGPIFTHILLADEINRAPPKTQAALLEAMQERQTTLEGETYPLDTPFVVLATQNPIEFEGTYPLPEAQIDRFLIKIGMGYPSKEDEVEILARRRSRKKEEVNVDVVAGPKEVKEMQRALEDIHLDPDLERYIVELVDRTRMHSQVEVGSSPRGSLALMKLARARAALEGRDYVLPDDIKAAAIPGLAHRLILKPDPWIRGVKTESVVETILENVPVPKVG
ncbi:MAG: MoxR family ATPase [Candidatus Thermoplasmatota archaeon]|nr:MoxR family ATPase [Candidatus Thermoplasmatota archaeon]